MKGAVGAAVYWYAGARLWVCAAWLDRRLKPGKVSTPKQARVGFGFVMAA